MALINIEIQPRTDQIKTITDEQLQLFHEIVLEQCYDKDDSEIQEFEMLNIIEDEWQRRSNG